MGHSEWDLLEAEDYAGGLAASFADEKGFTWDIGGHVQFSHYEYFDRLMLELLGKEGWLHHQRESWVWIRDRFVPYPFQNNLRRLPKEELAHCLSGLVKLYRNPSPKPTNFREWILATFGDGIAEVFLLPYNFKVWAHPPELMNTGWVGERVAVADLDRILHNLVFERDDVSWGPNSTFQFPRHGGTGAIWRECARRLPVDRLHYRARVCAIHPGERRVETEDGRFWPYDALVSTLPLDRLLELAGQSGMAMEAAPGLLRSSSNILGIGLRGKPREELATKCWMYFPEANCPFYRVTVFSNYSPNNVPDIGKYWSLMTETSESTHKAVDPRTLVEETIQGLLNARLIERREDIVSVWKHRAEFGYPIPGLGRDEVLGWVMPWLEERGIWSRGRFGGWKYEVSNQDHSCMQGVEVVDRLLRGTPEMTFPDPNRANARKHALNGVR
jgi:protoporphyrinogen oxidase